MPSESRQESRSDSTLERGYTLVEGDRKLMKADLKYGIRQLIDALGPGQITASVYDIAWVARLAEIDIPMGMQSLAWLRDHQLPDGSWGTSSITYHHDRVVCTLAALTTLARQKDSRDHMRIRRGLQALEWHINGLKADPAGDTIGFELIVPRLMDEAASLGIVQPIHGYFGQLIQRRKAKLSAVPDGVINRHMTVAFSAEMLAPEEQRLLDLENLREANGSVACSPAATAWYLLNIEPDPAALQFLRTATVDTTSASPYLVPYIAPIDVFEVAWALWNLALAGLADDPTLVSLCQPHLDFLENNWQPGVGMRAVSPSTISEGDTTSLVSDVLVQFGRSACLDDLLAYEESDYFRCYKLEANPSLSANIHVLGALRQAGLKIDHPSVQKVLGFLGHSRTLESYWFDKWHASPYYPTAHAVIAGAEYADALVEAAVEWIIATQHKNGAWGYYGATAEETAYCLQALTIWRRAGKPTPVEALRRGRDWLAEHRGQADPPLWIGKMLYSPVLVDQSAILSALTLVSEM